MKILIAYSSLTGNTKKLAMGLAKVIKNSELKEISKELNYEDYDIILVGTWIRRATAEPKAKEFIERIKNKKVGFFFTLGAYPNSDYALNRCKPNIENLFLENNNEIIGSFHCHGKISEQLQERIKNREDKSKNHGGVDEAKLKRWKDASIHPNEEDIKNIQEYFKNILSL